MDWHTIKTLKLDVTFMELTQRSPPQEDYEWLDPEPLWIERVVQRLLHVLKNALTVAREPKFLSLHGQATGEVEQRIGQDAG